MHDDASQLRAGDLRDTLVQGSQIAGRYRIERRLGEGAVGAVYLAEHVHVGRRVALKVLSWQWARHASMVQRFKAEARAASAIGCDGIVDVLDAGDLEDGRPYIAMEYLEGRELLHAFDEAGRMPVARTCRIMRDVARAIAAAHDAGIIHRDLKAENVMLVGSVGNERVKVLDFGIAAVVSEAIGRKTVPGTIMGTPAYMSPEQATGATATPGFDIYAIGVLIFEALTGDVPFADVIPLRTLARKTVEEPPALEDLRPDAPPQLCRLVNSCLSREPERRPRTARDIADELQDILEEIEEEDTGAVPLSPESTTSHSAAVVAPAPSPMRALLLVAGAAALAGLVALALLQPSDEDGAPVPEVASAEIAVTPASDLSAGADRSREPDVGTEQPLPVEEVVTLEDAPIEVVAPEPSKPAPERKIVAKRVPKPASKTVDKPPAETDGEQEARCEMARDRADAARSESDWAGILRHTQDRGCWRGQTSERTKLRTKAYLELKDFGRCAKAGSGSADSEVETWVKICKSRAG